MVKWQGVEGRRLGILFGFRHRNTVSSASYLCGLTPVEFVFHAIVGCRSFIVTVTESHSELPRPSFRHIMLYRSEFAAEINRYHSECQVITKNMRRQQQGTGQLWCKR